MVGVSDKYSAQIYVNGNGTLTVHALFKSRVEKRYRRILSISCDTHSDRSARAPTTCNSDYLIPLNLVTCRCREPNVGHVTDYMSKLDEPDVRKRGL